MKVVERLAETRKRKEEEDGLETPERRRKASEAVVLIEQGLKLKQENGGSMFMNLLTDDPHKHVLELCKRAHTLYNIPVSESAIF